MPGGSSPTRTASAGAATRRVGEAIPVASLPVPRGWFAVATSAALRPGRAVPARIGDEQLVVWRTERSALGAAVAWCPHLGADLGRTGRVRGELLECGFHGFCFGIDGRCEATGYGGRVPKGAAIATLPVRETGGIVLAWHDPGGGVPDFDLPELPLEGWTPPRFATSTFAGHPFETTENSVDVGHLAVLHGYDEVAEVEPATVCGATLHARYEMTRGGHVSGVRLPTMRTEFEVTVHGLGVSIVDLTVHTIGACQRLYVLPTPIGDGRVLLRLGVTSRLEPTDERPALLRRVPPAIVARAAREMTLLALYYDVVQDRKVWTTKRHLPHPLLAEGDGPIGLYRKWGRQFLEPASPATRPAEGDRPAGAAATTA